MRARRRTETDVVTCRILSDRRWGRVADTPRDFHRTQSDWGHLCSGITSDVVGSIWGFRRIRWLIGWIVAHGWNVTRSIRLKSRGRFHCIEARSGLHSTDSTLPFAIKVLVDSFQERLDCGWRVEFVGRITMGLVQVRKAD